MSIAGYILVGFGLVFLILGIIFFMVSKACNKYTAGTKGIVTGYCRNAFDFNQGGSGKNQIGISTGSSSTNTRCLTYAYEVNGVKYEKANNVAINKSQAERKVNKEVAVYYNPARPEQSRLSKQGALHIIGIVFIPVGVVVCLLGVVLRIVCL